MTRQRLVRLPNFAKSEIAGRVNGLNLLRGEGLIVELHFVNLPLEAGGIAERAADHHGSGVVVQGAGRASLMNQSAVDVEFKRGAVVSPDEQVPARTQGG